MCIRKMADAIGQMEMPPLRRAADAAQTARVLAGGRPWGRPRSLSNVLNQKGRNCNYRAVSLDEQAGARPRGLR